MNERAYREYRVPDIEGGYNRLDPVRDLIGELALSTEQDPAVSDACPPVFEEALSLVQQIDGVRFPVSILEPIVQITPPVRYNTPEGGVGLLRLRSVLFGEKTEDGTIHQHENSCVVLMVGRVTAEASAGEQHLLYALYVNRLTRYTLVGPRAASRGELNNFRGLIDKWRAAVFPRANVVANTSHGHTGTSKGVETVDNPRVNL